MLQSQTAGESTYQISQTESVFGLDDARLFYETLSSFYGAQGTVIDKINRQRQQMRNTSVSEGSW